MTSEGGGEMVGPTRVSAASAVLEGLPLSRWHWRLVVIVGIGTFFDLYEVFLGGVLAPVLAKEFELGSLGKAMVIAAGFAGMFIGANVLSIAADRLGRRRVFILNLLVYSVFSAVGRLLAEHRDIPRAACHSRYRTGRGTGAGRHLSGRVHPCQVPRADDGVGVHDWVPRCTARGAARRQIGGA